MKVLFMFLNVLSMYKVVWENIDIEIPLNEDTYQYYEIPKANLYYNDILIKTDIYYERGVNHTNLNVVNSRHVKTFKIDYRVYFDEYEISSTQTIHFNVIDNIAPVFIKIPEIKMPVKTKILSEKEIIEGLIYEDNYYQKEDLTVKINGLSSVNINVPNIYELEYEIIDPSFNITYQKGYYIVDNNVSPEIKYKDLIQINYGETFNYLKHFQFVDNYDKNLITEADVSNIDFNKVGIYPIVVRATNNAGLTTTITTNIEIIDKEKPRIVLKTNNILNVKTYNNDYLKSVILSVSDNYDNLSIDDVIIEGEVDFNVVNKYEVTYYISDSNNNVTSQKITIEIKDLENPNVELIDNLDFNINSLKPNWYKYFNINDNYDNFDNLTIAFNDKNINFNVLGLQMLEVTVTDSSKNKIIKNYEINILDLEAPQVIQMEEIIIIDFSSKNSEYFKNYFAISDNYNEYKDIIVNINGNISYNKVGQYEIDIDFIDSSNNITTIKTSAYVLDIIKPKIKLRTNVYYYYLGEEPLILENYIINVSDNNTIKENLIINIIENINYEKTGQYDVIYEVYDESNNVESETLSVYVDKRKTNLLTGKDLYLKVNENHLIGSSVVFSEEVVKIVTYPSFIDTKKVGIKEILYVVYDSRGHYEEYLQTIYIEDNKSFNEYKNNLIVTALGVIVIISYYIYERKNNNNF